MIDLAKVVIWAEDMTAAATESVQRNLLGVGSASEYLDRKLRQLAGLASFAFFAKMVKDAFEAQARVKDLAIEAGMTVEQLSRFEEVGRTGGDGLEGIAAAVGKLSKSMVEAKDPTSAQAQALKAINLSWAELKGLSPDEQLIKIAKAQAQFGGSLEKNAVMMALFSKGGGKFQVTLNEITEAQKLVATTTQKQADEADRLTDELAKLKLQSDLVWRSLASNAVPALNSILEAFVEGKREAGLYEGAVRALSAVFDAINGTGPVEQLKRIELQLKATKTTIEDLESKPSWWKTLFATDDNMKSALAMQEALRKQRDGLLREIHDLELAAQNKRALAGMRPPRQVNFDPEAAKLADEELKAFEAANLELDKQLALLREKEQLGRALTESEKLLAEIETGKYKKLTPLHQAELKRKAELFSVEQKRAIAAKADLDARLAEAGALGKNLEALNEKIAAATLENETYGKTGSQIALLTAMRLEERRAQLLALEGTELQVMALEFEIAKYRELAQVLGRGEARKAYDEAAKKSAQDQVSFWGTVGDAAGNFFSDLVMNGRSAFDNLRKFAKQLLADMLALFAKRWILQLAGAAAGGSATTAGASLLSAAGDAYNGTGLAGAALSYGSSVYGGFTGASALATAEAAGELTTSGILVTEGTGMTATGVGAGLYEALAAIPVWGWIAMAVIAAFVYFSGRGGGPKPGGSFMGGFDSSGAFTGEQSVPGTDNGRFFTPSQGDAAMRDFTMGVSEGFYRTLTRLGGTTAGLSFGFGFDRDPSGTAENRVSAMVRGADGRVLYSNTQTAGRDDEDFNRAIALQTRRAILAGLQASEFPEALAAIFDSLDVASATAEQIDGILALGEAMHGLLETLSPINVEELLAGASRTAIEAWRAQGVQLRDLAGDTQLTVESLQQLSQATGQYRAQAAALILQFENARRSVDAGIEGTIRDFRFQTLDRQGQYDLLRGEASTLAGQLGGMQDAGQLVEAVNQIRALSSQAFGMLSDEERRSLFPQFEAGLRETQRQADERLETLRNQVRDEANQQLADQRQIVTDMATAADKMEAAARTFDAASTRFAEAEIPVRVTGSFTDGSFEVQPGGA